MTDQITELDISTVDPPVDVDRDMIDPEAVRELAESIRSQGLLQPVLVRPVNGRYEMVAGHRRLLAHQLIGAPTILSIVRELSDEETFVIRAIENDQRVDLNPIEKAKIYRKLKDKLSWSNDKIAQKMGRSLMTVKRHLKLLDIPPEYQKAVGQGRLGIAVAIILNEIDEESFKRMYFGSAIENGVTAEVAEQWVLDWKKTRLNLSPEEGGTGGGEQGIPEIMPTFQPCLCCFNPTNVRDLVYIGVCRRCSGEIRGALRPEKP